MSIGYLWKVTILHSSLKHDFFFKMMCLALKISLPVFGFRLKRPALLPAWILYDTLPFSPSSSSRAITYKTTNLSMRPGKKEKEKPLSCHNKPLRKLLLSFFSSSTGHQNVMFHSPHRLILHHADRRRRAKDRRVVIFVRHKHSGGHGTPAPLRGIHCLVCGPHHEVKRGRRLTI